MAPWRVAKSLETLRAQINAEFPNRAKHSDGTIGDAAHSSRSSDHNPWVRDGQTGVVTALDITHDPKNGVDAGALAEALLASRDDRIKYIISNRRICSGAMGPSAWRWRPYNGANPHTKHLHLSVGSEKRVYDDTRKWDFSSYSPAMIAPLADIPEANHPEPAEAPWPSEHDRSGNPLTWFKKAWRWLAGIGGTGALSIFDWRVAIVVASVGLLIFLVVWFFPRKR